MLQVMALIDSPVMEMTMDYKDRDSRYLNLGEYKIDKILLKYG